MCTHPGKIITQTNKSTIFRRQPRENSALIHSYESFLYLCFLLTSQKPGESMNHPERAALWEYFMERRIFQLCGQHQAHVCQTPSVRWKLFLSLLLIGSESLLRRLIGLLPTIKTLRTDIYHVMQQLCKNTRKRLFLCAFISAKFVAAYLNKTPNAMKQSWWAQITLS